MKYTFIVPALGDKLSPFSHGAVFCLSGYYMTDDRLTICAKKEREILHKNLDVY